MKKLFNNLFSKRTSIASLVIFRVVFGVLMIISTLRFMMAGWINEHFIDPPFHFKFYGFEWVEVLSPFGMYVLHGVMLLASVGITLGLFYRLSAAVLFLTFTYVELIDLTYYLNHYYFVSLICLLLIFISANGFASLDVKFNFRKPLSHVPAWNINILKFQIFFVYFYAGLAKLNYDWLVNSLPLKIWLPANDKIPFLGSFFAHEYAPYIFSWGGMLYDTFIVFFLLWKPTRIWAYICVIIFHTIVGILFQIGIFPVMMIGVTLIFFSWEFIMPNAFAEPGEQLPTTNKQVEEPKIEKYYNKRIQNSLLIGFIVFQFLFPWRYVLYPGSLFWTEEGYRFSWRVMLMEKAGTATFYVKGAETNREGIVNNLEFLNTHQEKQMAMQPDMILQFAHFLGEYYEKQGVKNPQVRVEAWVTLNARPSQLLIDPKVDLMTKADGWKHKEWILPLDNQSSE
ncbi:MAG: putative membrane protein YphA (DoxX/SURF4 family) [Spirosomataceae bacterium]